MKKNGIYLVGSTFFSSLKIGEVAQEENFSRIVYERSRAGLKVSDLDSYLKENFFGVYGAKFFFNIGDEDLKCENFSLKKFVLEYEWALFNLHEECKKSTIKVLSVVSKEEKCCEANRLLKEMAKNYGCDFIDITEAAKIGRREIFHAMKNSMREFPIDFFSAMMSA